MIRKGYTPMEANTIDKFMNMTEDEYIEWENEQDDLYDLLVNEIEYRLQGRLDKIDIENMFMDALETMDKELT